MHRVPTRCHLSGKGMCQLMPRVLLDGHAFLIFQARSPRAAEFARHFYVDIRTKNCAQRNSR
jgi:hypothetical protein